MSDRDELRRRYLAARERWQTPRQTSEEKSAREKALKRRNDLAKLEAAAMKEAEQRAHDEMAAGSIAGTIVGGLLLGVVPSAALMQRRSTEGEKTTLPATFNI
ncbi:MULTISPECIES: hypothetical protein [Nocardia]|uniref:hypothetical protein n=1 Tax=Nocardia TaxID=1817 RepID=UPI00135898C3|nr:MULTISPECIES: hypothetical protein [Nocardia]